MAWLINVIWVGIPVVIALIFGVLGAMFGFERRWHDEHGYGHGTNFPSVIIRVSGFLKGFVFGGIFGLVVALIVSFIMKWCGWL